MAESKATEPKCAVCGEDAKFCFHIRRLGGDVPLCSDDCGERFVEDLRQESLEISKPQATPMAIWGGPAQLYWRRDAFGHNDRALFVGRLHVGSIMYAKPHPRENRSPNKVWRAWLMTDDDGSIVGWYATEQEAKVALVGAAIEAIER
jgi:hypothetical protein